MSYNVLVNAGYSGLGETAPCCSSRPHETGRSEAFLISRRGTRRSASASSLWSNIWVQLWQNAVTSRSPDRTFWLRFETTDFRPAYAPWGFIFPGVIWCPPVVEPGSPPEPPPLRALSPVVAEFIEMRREGGANLGRIEAGVEADLLPPLFPSRFGDHFSFGLASSQGSVKTTWRLQQWHWRKEKKYIVTTKSDKKKLTLSGHWGAGEPIAALPAVAKVGDIISISDFDGLAFLLEWLFEFDRLIGVCDLEKDPFNFLFDLASTIPARNWDNCVISPKIDFVWHCEII